MLKLLMLIVTLLALSGCATTGGMFTNRIIGTLAGDECSVNSKWGMFGITTPIDEKDCNAIKQLIEAATRR